jgi:hypothetical protein
VDIALGVSMTPTTVRMVLVEGEKADGVTVDHDVFDITGTDGAATLSAPEQVIAAILGTRESAAAGGHRLLSTGVAWSDHADGAALRAGLAGRGIHDVMLVSQLHAAGALAQAAGRVVGDEKTALMFVERETATLSVVDTADGSIVKVHSRSLHGSDAMAVLTDMVSSLEETSSPPDRIFLMGAGVDVAAAKEHLAASVTIPLNAPDDPEMALARGAALAAANAPEFDASTVGLAYAQDPDGTTAGRAYPAELGAGSASGPDSGSSIDDTAADFGSQVGQQRRKPFLLVGSSLTAIFAVGVVALVISLAVSIRPTVDTRPNPGIGAARPNSVAPPAALPNEQLPAQPPAVAPPASPAPPPVAQTITEPTPVVQQQPAPRRVVAAPAPEAPPPEPAPAALPAPAPYNPPAAVPPAPYYPAAPSPAISPVIPILPPFISIGPGPGYRPPAREYGPRWYPPQQQWPSGPGGYGPGGYGPGSYGPGGGGIPGPRGGPLWPWPGD